MEEMDAETRRQYLAEFDKQLRWATMHALSELTQTTTVAAFQAAFEGLLDGVIGISESLLVTFCICGLRPEVRRELRHLPTPFTLQEAFTLAYICEARATNSGSLSGPLKPTAISTPTPIPPAIPSSTPPTTLLAPPKATLMPSIPPSSIPSPDPSIYSPFDQPPTVQIYPSTRPSTSPPSLKPIIFSDSLFPILSPDPFPLPHSSLDPPPDEQKQDIAGQRTSSETTSMSKQSGVEELETVMVSHQAGMTSSDLFSLSKPPPDPPDPDPIVKREDYPILPATIVPLSIFCPDPSPLPCLRPDPDSRKKMEELPTPARCRGLRTSKNPRTSSVATTKKQGPANFLKLRYASMDHYEYDWRIVKDGWDATNMCLKGMKMQWIKYNVITKILLLSRLVRVRRIDHADRMFDEMLHKTNVTFLSIKSVKFLGMAPRQFRGAIEAVTKLRKDPEDGRIVMIAKDLKFLSDISETLKILELKKESQMREFYIPDYIFEPGLDVEELSYTPQYPVVVVINSRSGDQLGGDLLITYQKLLIKVQVLDLGEEAPDKRLCTHFNHWMERKDVMANVPIYKAQVSALEAHAAANCKVFSVANAANNFFKSMTVQVMESDVATTNMLLSSWIRVKTIGDARKVVNKLPHKSILSHLTDGFSMFMDPVGGQVSKTLDEVHKSADAMKIFSRTVFLRRLYVDTPIHGTFLAEDTEGYAILWGAQVHGEAPHNFQGAVAAMKFRNDPKPKGCMMVIAKFVVCREVIQIGPVNCLWTGNRTGYLFASREKYVEVPMGSGIIKLWIRNDYVKTMFISAAQLGGAMLVIFCAACHWAKFLHKQDHVKDAELLQLVELEIGALLSAYEFSGNGVDPWVYKAYEFLDVGDPYNLKTLRHVCIH